MQSLDGTDEVLDLDLSDFEEDDFDIEEDLDSLNGSDIIVEDEQEEEDDFNLDKDGEDSTINGSDFDLGDIEETGEDSNIWDKEDEDSIEAINGSDLDIEDYEMNLEENDNYSEGDYYTGEEDFQNMDYDASDYEDSDEDGYFGEDDGIEEEDDLEEIEDEVVDSKEIFNEEGDIVVMDKDGKAFELEYIPMKDIVIPDRIRKSVNVAALQRSIESTGLLKPITVARTATDGLYVLLDGYKRMYAASKAGLKEIAAVINNKVSTTEISILEALYNHYTSYSTKEKVDYIHFLENEKEIRNQNTIEYLLQMEPGDYPKLKDILNDDDPDIIDPLFSGKFTIEQAFNKLKSKRAKQSKEEKELEKAAKVYEGGTETGVEGIENSGDIGDGEPLSDEELAELGLDELSEETLENTTLEELVEEGNSIEGYEPHQQKVGEREYIDPAIRKAVLANQGTNCDCCKIEGPEISSILDLHHVVPVFCGGKDAVDNSVMLCLNCHAMVHRHSLGQLHIVDFESKDEKDQNKFKRIVAYGNIIRKASKKHGMKIEELKKNTNVDKIGRNKPGKGQSTEQA